MAMAEIPLMLAMLAQAIQPSQTLPADRIVQAVQQEVSARLQAVGSSAQVRVLERPEDQRLPMGRIRIEVGAAAGRWPRSRASVPVQLWVDDRPIRSTSVWIEMNDERTVLTYAEDYPERTDGAGIRTVARHVDMVCCAGAPLAQAGDLKGHRIRHSVRSGQPVMQGDLESPPDVLARERVDIEVISGSVRVLTKGVSLDDGKIGERVHVRTGESGKPIEAVVIAGERVRVDE